MSFTFLRIMAKRYPWAGRGAVPDSTYRAVEIQQLFVENNAQQGGVHSQLSVVLDESQVSELVHEKVDARTRRADHLGKRFLRDFRYALLRSLPFTEPRQQYKVRASRFSLELKR